MYVTSKTIVVDGLDHAIEYIVQVPSTTILPMSPVDGKILSELRHKHTNYEQILSSLRKKREYNDVVYQLVKNKCNALLMQTLINQAEQEWLSLNPDNSVLLTGPMLRGKRRSINVFYYTTREGILMTLTAPVNICAYILQVAKHQKVLDAPLMTFWIVKYTNFKENSFYLKTGYWYSEAYQYMKNEYQNFLIFAYSRAQA